MENRRELVTVEKVDEAISIILSTESETDLFIGGIKIEGRFCKEYKILLSSKENGEPRANVISMAKNLLSTLIFSGGMPFAVRKEVKNIPIEWRLATSS